MDLLEREPCLADLEKWLGTAVECAGCVALLAGEAGIGKTALLREFARRQNQVRVLWGACDALFTPRPRAPLHDIALQTQGALLAAVNSSATPGTLFATALDELTRERTLLVFEDMHWADEATLDLITFLGRRINRTRTLLVASYRDDELGERHPLRLVMGGLPREEVPSECRLRRFRKPRWRSWRSRQAAPRRACTASPGSLRRLRSR